jgi:hypothetical protein
MSAKMAMQFKRARIRIMSLQIHERVRLYAEDVIFKEWED